MAVKIIKLADASEEMYTKITAIDTKVNFESSSIINVSKTQQVVELSGRKPISTNDFSSASRRTIQLLSAFVPIPSNVRFSFDNNWSITQFSATDIITSKMLGVIAEHGFDKVKMTDVAREFGGSYLSIINTMQSIVDVDAINRRFQKGGHVAFNPFKELLYDGPDFRRFSFTWDFAPKTQADAKNILTFIDNMAYYASPDTMDTAYSPYVLPATFEIEFVGTKFPKLQSLVAVSVDVDYSASGNTRIFVDGRPVFTRLTVSFVELDRVVKSNFKGVEFDGQRQ